MIRPSRAPVRPRMYAPASGEPVLLEEEVRRLIETRRPGRIAILGPVGSGKTTSLEHLAAVLPENPDITVLDEPGFPDILAAGDKRLVFYTTRARSRYVADAVSLQTAFMEATLELAPWTGD